MTRANPARIAAEMKRRSDYLRSRSWRRKARWEDGLVCELDLLEAQARALAVQQALGSLPEAEVMVEARQLELAALELRGRFYERLDRERGRGGQRRYG